MSKDICAYPKCGKELIHIEGRKKKKYCDANCKVKHWQQLHPPEPKKEKDYVKIPKSEWDKIQKSLSNPSEGIVIKDFTQDANKSNRVITVEPKEGSMAFYKKYDAFTYKEAEEKKSTTKDNQ